MDKLEKLREFGQHVEEELKEEFPFEWKLGHFLLGQAHGTPAFWIRVLTVIGALLHFIVYYVSALHSYDFPILERGALAHLVISFIHLAFTPCSLSMQKASRLFDPAHLWLTIIPAFVTGPVAIIHLQNEREKCENDPFVAYLCRIKDVSSVGDPCVAGSLGACPGPDKVSQRYFSIMGNLQIAVIVITVGLMVVQTVLHSRFRSHHTKFHLRRVHQKRNADRQRNDASGGTMGGAGGGMKGQMATALRTRAVPAPVGQGEGDMDASSQHGGGDGAQPRVTATRFGGDGAYDRMGARGRPQISDMT